MDYHGQIMNIPCEMPEYDGDSCKHPPSKNDVWERAYREGHRDARHAAAELVAEVPPPEGYDPKIDPPPTDKHVIAQSGVVFSLVEYNKDRTPLCDRWWPMPKLYKADKDDLSIAGVHIPSSFIQIYINSINRGMLQDEIISYIMREQKINMEQACIVYGAILMLGANP